MEKYYHRFCIKGDTTNDSCGKHTGCHSMFAIEACPECDLERTLVSKNLSIDSLRVTKEEYLAIRADIDSKSPPPDSRPQSEVIIIKK